MCKKCKYVTKIETKNSKQDIVLAFEGVKKILKDNYNLSFVYMMVGSAKRNMVYRRGNSSWDIDFQVYINRDKFREVLGNDRSIKELFFNHLKSKMPKYSFQNSKSVITANKSINDSNGFSSYDIAILSKDSNNSIYKLFYDKKKENYIWNELGNNSKDYLKLKEIKGIKEWKFLRQTYLDKKCNSVNAVSTSLFLESISETLQYFNK